MPQMMTPFVYSTFCFVFEKIELYHRQPTLSCKKNVETVREGPLPIATWSVEFSGLVLATGWS